jgi:DNA-binding transcriptional MerR regulator/methylmalonyl-CoA mutase cobalamin-binding subunit
MNQRTMPQPLTVSIAAVERDTGIGKDTLRIWERRYGFPQPGRDAYGERSYNLEQVEKLRVIKRLLDQGHRPGRIVALPVEALQRLSQGQSGTPQKMAMAVSTPELRDFMACILGHDAEGLRRKLHQALAAMGHFRFVTDLVAPLNGMVGDGWMRGELQIFEEHLYTESITSVLRQAINNIPQPDTLSQPKVLLTTFPQEPHGLGLLMAECLLALEGCRCISLGTQTPLRDMVMGIQAHQVNVIALSFSVSMNPNHVLDGLTELRQQLPTSVEIWAGGRCPVLHRRELPGIVVLGPLEDIPLQVQNWRLRHTA